MRGVGSSHTFDRQVKLGEIGMFYGDTIFIYDTTVCQI